MSVLKEGLLEVLSSIQLDRSPTLLALITSDDFVGVIQSSIVTAVMQETGHESVEALMQDLIPLAKVYAAIPPISKYPVGTVAQGLSGSLYFGFNQEYPGASLGDSMHGEQASVINAWSRGETGLRSITVTAAPCGHCRQFLYEINGGAKIQVLFPGVSVLLEDLLPKAFGPKNLGVQSGLMSSAPVFLDLPERGQHDKLANLGLAAASFSYAPYSKGYAGVVLETASKTILGRYAENAAFNPSVYPLPAALVMLRLSGLSHSDLRRALLVHVESDINHYAKVDLVLKSVSSTCPLGVYRAHELTGA